VYVSSVGSRAQCNLYAILQDRYDTDKRNVELLMQRPYVLLAFSMTGTFRRLKHGDYKIPLELEPEKGLGVNSESLNQE